MPSIKPNYNEIKKLRKERNLLYPPENIFTQMYQECSAAIEGGFINEKRASKLLQYIKSDKKIRSLFPNNLLFEILNTYCNKNEWTLKNERTIFDFIVNLYIKDSSTPMGITVAAEYDQNNDDFVFTVGKIKDITSPPELNHSLIDLYYGKYPFEHELKDYIYDSLPHDIEIKNRFITFTGKFENFTRKTCFETVRSLGGVPADPSFFNDFLFVANEHVKANVISSTLSLSIILRRQFGSPLIFTETDWNNIVEL